MTDEQLIRQLQALRGQMVSVAQAAGAAVQTMDALLVMHAVQEEPKKKPRTIGGNRTPEPEQGNG